MQVSESSVLYGRFQVAELGGIDEHLERNCHAVSAINLVESVWGQRVRIELADADSCDLRRKLRREFGVDLRIAFSTIPD